MVFSSSVFLLYFLPVFLLIYYLLPYRLRNSFILLSSLVFFSWGAPKFIFLVLISVFIDFYIVRFINESSGRQRRLLVALSVLLNVGMLAYFKYANFFIENFNTILTSLGVNPAKWMNIALPIGISFFTFQKITYTVDVYRRVHAPLHKPIDYAMYILMFPHLIAGPIVRFNLVADQIEDRRYNETLENRYNGFFRFVIGLSKKVLIANVLGAEVDRIFAMNPLVLDTGLAWTGIIAYAFQIYFDFSGYSDMAIGLALMIGFNFPENFNNPYISQSITEFWRRWHMTLGRFMREYLYIPLGGNRVSTARMYFNLWVVFFLSGLWHGAAWNFVIWGVFHGLFLVADRLFLLKFYEKIGKVPSIFITFLITLIGWVFFRSASITQAFDYLQAMFAFRFTRPEFIADYKFIIIMMLAIIFSFMAVFKGVEEWQSKVLSLAGKWIGISWRMAFALIFFIISLSSITSSGFNPFIYFRF